ncbi:hypothetical protein WN55_07663 [Dufourea novaeangliae]|uniref:Uncharacterized protein n=1 Tax=Dufourea novaeangliae TaxID=178035 RepID=A0A154P5W9_DUFNO|nr:hypothetical protein WN55_07663 [Dufourea novaeangliae]
MSIIQATSVTKQNLEQHLHSAYEVCRGHTKYCSAEDEEWRGNRTRSRVLDVRTNCTWRI